MFIFYFLMTASRFIMIYTFSPLMNMTGYPITNKDIFILSYGGLRGAIALCLGLMVYTDEDYSQRFRDLVLFYLTGMITMTVLFNGMTMKWVMLQVDIFPENKLRIKVKNTLIKGMVISGLKQEQKIKNNRFLTLANWNAVEEMSGISAIVKSQTKDFNGQELNILNQANNAITQDETLIEIRYRIYRLIKSQFWQKFEESFCGSSVVSMLNESVDFCMDSLDEKVWIYECVSENIIATDRLQHWLSYRNTLFIGMVYRSFLNNYLSQTYEMLSTLIVSLEDLLEKKPNIPLSQEYVNVIFAEVAANKEKAEQQLFLLCDIFPDLIGSLQNKQAAQMIMRAQKEELKDDYQNGLITEDEHSSLVDDTNKRINKLNHMGLSWEIEGVRNFSLVSPLFHTLGEIDLQKLNNSHVLNKFPPNSIIYKKDQPVHGIYIMSSGMVEDAVTVDSKTRYGLGAVLSWPNILTTDSLAKTTLTAVNNVNAYFIPKEVMLAVFESNLSFEDHIYKSALPAFFKLYPPKSHEIDLTDDLVAHIQKNCKLVTKSQGEVLSLEFGGFLVSGELKMIDEDTSRGSTTILTPRFISPTAGIKNYRVEKKIKLIRLEASILDFEDGLNDMRRSIMGGIAHHSQNTHVATGIGLSTLSPQIKGSLSGLPRTSVRNSITMMVNKEKDVEKIFENLIKTRFRHLAN
jgi:Sodium/hydrogen exchanger family/Cyclic nucleotide-binding domain